VDVSGQRANLMLGQHFTSRCPKTAKACQGKLNIFLVSFNIYRVLEFKQGIRSGEQRKFDGTQTYTPSRGQH
jgi:hypothetical protein